MNIKATTFITAVSAFALLVFTVGCDADTEVDQTVEEILSAQPAITSFSPASADIQSRVLIRGTYLNFASKAYVGDTECRITQRINGETLEIEVAPEAESGVVRIATSAGKEASSPEQLSVTYPQPAVSSELPEGGMVNENIVIEGTNLRTVTKITFGGTEAIIQFKEAQALVVSVPNNEGEGQEVRMYYNTASGETSVALSAGFSITIPTPVINNWPQLMNRDSEVFITGEDLNLVTSVTIDGQEAPINASSATALNFNVPEGVQTGYRDIAVHYGTDKQLVREGVPYINGQYEKYIEFDTDPESVFALDLSKDPLAVQQLNGNAEQPPFPGASYYNLQMNTGTGSTIARMRLHSETANETWQQILDPGNFGDNPVLHFWINTEGTAPILKLYIGGTSNANRRELSGGNTNTGEGWKLYAVRLKDFIPGLTSVGSAFEIRLNTGSGASVFPVVVNLDWIVVTDQVLTEFGAEDVTDLFKPAG
ncbi:IPT/TIG domain-containing protein [Sinomicrobium soli]|uniref:IPT/TIG domain-containing protein n=1 Tax=Sinomicrobium sp. N-1-3-6 TaxID=2219864 RepID=UPI001374E0E4|nr:IPT/TIG domain-containing protein [Sinomicrobium sp. N-1-3-6]